MPDEINQLTILIAIFIGFVTGYMIGRSRRATEFDVLQFELVKTRDQLNAIRRLYSMDEQK